jgi:tRNA(Ile)-lysidine synthase TilS/MesJ
MGNLLLFRWYGSYEDAEEKDPIPRIKPLKHVREEEIALYAYYHGLLLMELECPYVQGALWIAPSR